MNQEQVSVSIETKDGRAVRTYVHDGRSYIESHEDMVYRIRVKNKTGKRIKAVIAVDSVSIVTGQPITDKPDETGYILGPYAEELFRGYRVDQNQVAEFKFVKREASYATEKGEGGNNGVIAVRAYAEKEKPSDKSEFWKRLWEAERNRPKEKEYIWPNQWYPVWRPYWERPYHWQPYYHTTTDLLCRTTESHGGVIGYNASNVMGVCNTNGALAGVTLSNLGTTVTNANVGVTLTAQSCMVDPNVQSTKTATEPIFAHGSSWGDALAEKVTEVAFEVGELLAELAIYYAPLAGLEALGINLSKDKQIAFPEPFKREYASPPKGWASGTK